ncbi:MAG TPA: hypothetical protein VKP65_02175, partial [Rhodothermales bacterium]|nr:hypothetical protein [Rhodothermales bacterium]
MLLLAGMGCGATAVDEEPENAIRILFIGNSLTQANNLPEMVAAMAEADRTRPVVIHEVTAGGTSLEDHWFLGRARETIQNDGPWDFVVMQQGPSSLPENQQHLAHWAQMFATEIRAAGAIPALYMVWPGQARHFAFGDVVASYTNAAKAADARLLPAGSAFLAAWDRRSDLALYSADDFHPSPMGSYLAALV